MKRIATIAALVITGLIFVLMQLQLTALRSEVTELRERTATRMDGLWNDARMIRKDLTFFNERLTHVESGAK